MKNNSDSFNVLLAQLVEKYKINPQAHMKNGSLSLGTLFQSLCDSGIITSEDHKKIMSVTSYK